MILNIKSSFYKIFNLFFLLVITNISNLYAHNFFNGGCKDHCEEKVKEINKNNKYNNINYQKEIDNNNSCLKKSLCRG